MAATGDQQQLAVMNVMLENFTFNDHTGPMMPNVPFSSNQQFMQTGTFLPQQGYQDAFAANPTMRGGPGGGQPYEQRQGSLAPGGPIGGQSSQDQLQQQGSSAGPPPSSGLQPMSGSGVSFQCPLRPTAGCEGRPIMLRANHFSVRIPAGTIQHYLIDIQPDKCPRRVNREIVATLINSYAKVFHQISPVYDGKRNMYTRDMLPIGREKYDFTVILPGDTAVERQFRVSLKWDGQVSLSALEDAMDGKLRQVPFEAVQALDVILRHLPSLRYDCFLCIMLLDILLLVVRSSRLPHIHPSMVSTMMKASLAVAEKYGSDSIRVCDQVNGK